MGEKKTNALNKQFVPRQLFGRRQIFTDAKQITRENVVSEVRNALNVHLQNRADIDYLWNYYKGKQPILGRVKEVRPEINNRIVENRAYEIVSFEVGYQAGEPIQYISRGGTDPVVSDISRLNEMMFSESKATKDKQIVEWAKICGISHRLVLPDKPFEEDEAPFEIFTLDPRDTFVVYSNSIGRKPLFGVMYVTDNQGHQTFDVYTKNMYFKIKGQEILEYRPHVLGMIPILEYPANSARMGSFEPVLPLLDGINTIASNRLDGVEQVVQAFIKFINADISADDFKELQAMGAIKVKSIDGQRADVDVVKNELNQQHTQTLIDHMYQSVLTITGMPNRNGGSSTSDTGRAVQMRDGWETAEARAKDYETVFKESEQEMLKLVLKICRDKGLLNLRLSDIGIQFTRRNYENIQSKSQVLVSMLQQDKVHPQLAFTHSGMFTDPEKAYTMSMEWWQEQRNLALKELEKTGKSIIANERQLNQTDYSEGTEQTQKETL